MTEETQPSNGLEVNPQEVNTPEQAAQVEQQQEQIETIAKAANEHNAELEKKFSQAELDDIIGKRVERERRKMLREMQEKAPAQQNQQLSREQFATDDEYVEALADKKADERIKQREIDNQVRAKEDNFREREELAREKYEDYDQVVYKNPLIKITEVMAEAIKESPVGEDIAYFLGTNHKESDRIAKMSQIAQIKEIGKIEEKLSAEPPKAKKTTSAPAPISPVKTTNSSPALDLSDPKSLEKLGTSAWIEADKARRIRELEAKSK